MNSIETELQKIKERNKKIAMEEYLKGNVSISGAAKIANITVWEIRKYLTENGVKSDYSIKDLEKERKKLK
jgi:predicted HTH domain antitoxin